MHNSGYAPPIAALPSLTGLLVRNRRRRPRRFFLPLRGALNVAWPFVHRAAECSETETVWQGRSEAGHGCQIERLPARPLSDRLVAGEPVQNVAFRAPPGFRRCDEWYFARARLGAPGLLGYAPSWFPLGRGHAGVSLRGVDFLGTRQRVSLRMRPRRMAYWALAPRPWRRRPANSTSISGARVA